MPGASVLMLSVALFTTIVAVAPPGSARDLPDCMDCPAPIVRVTPQADEGGASVSYTLGLGLGLGGAVAVYGDASVGTTGGVDCGGGVILGREAYDLYSCG